MGKIKKNMFVEIKMGAVKNMKPPIFEETEI